MNLEEFIKNLLSKGITIDVFVQRFADYCTTKSVDVTKSTPEELDAVFAEFLKQDDEAGGSFAQLMEAIAIAERLVAQLSGDMKPTGDELLVALNKVKDTMMAHQYPKPYPYPAAAAPAAAPDTAASLPPETPEEKACKKPRKTILESLSAWIGGQADDAEKAGEELDLAALQAEIGKFLETQFADSEEETKKSLSGLRSELTEEISKSTDGFKATLTEFAEKLKSLDTLGETLTKFSTDFQTLVTRVETVEKSVPRQPGTDTPAPEVKKGIFTGVFVPKKGGSKPTE